MICWLRNISSFENEYEDKGFYVWVFFVFILVTCSFILESDFLRRRLRIVGRIWGWVRFLVEGTLTWF